MPDKSFVEPSGVLWEPLFQRFIKKYGLDPSGSVHGPEASSCEQGNKPVGSATRGVFPY